jgi:hypothetical protein
MARGTGIASFGYVKSHTFPRSGWKGMNRIHDVTYMDPSYYYDLKNGYIDINGDLLQRRGIEKLNTTTFTNAARYGREIKWGDGSTDIIIREGERWAKYNRGTRVFDDLDTGRTSGAQGMAVMFEDKLILVDGGHARLMKQDGTIVDCGKNFLNRITIDGIEYQAGDKNPNWADAPSDATCVHVHAKRVFFNSSSRKMIIKHCASADVEDYTTANDAGEIDLSQVLNVGDEVMSFATYAKDFLVIFLRNHTIIYFFPETIADAALYQILPVGSICQYGPQHVGNDVMFPAKDGLKSLKYTVINQSLSVEDPSKLVDPFYKDIVSKFTTSNNVVCGFYHRLNHFYCLVPFAEGHQILVYSPYVKNIVGRFEGITGHCFFESESGDFYVCSDGFVYQMDAPDARDDDGTTIEYDFISGVNYFGNNNIFHGGKEFEINSDQDKEVALTFYYRYEFLQRYETWRSIVMTLAGKGYLYRATTSLYRSSYYRARGKELTKTMDVKGRGKGMQVRLYHNTAKARIRIPYYVIRVIDEGDV